MTTVKWICVSVVALVFIVMIGGGVGYFVYSFNKVTAQAARAEADYKIARDAQEVSEQTIAKLKEDYSNMQNDLLEWKSQAEKADKNLSISRKRIKQLEVENEEVRATLGTLIPCSIWLQLWPNSRRPDCYQGREAGQSQGATSAN